MRYLKPSPYKLEINQKEYEILYTLDIIDEIQDKTKMPMLQVINSLFDELTMKTAVLCLLKIMIPGIDLNIKDEDIPYIAYGLCTAYIEQCKSKKIVGQTPTYKDEIEFIDIEWLVYLGTVILGRDESEVWEMTLGKINTLYNEHLKRTGAIEEQKEVSLLTL